MAVRRSSGTAGLTHSPGVVGMRVAVAVELGGGVKVEGIITSVAGAQAVRMKIQISKLHIFFMQISILVQNKSTKQVTRLALAIQPKKMMHYILSNFT
jgi:hypothetical protein